MTEESGPPVTTEPRPVRYPIILTPPPLTPAQVQDIVDAINAANKAINSLGTISGALAKLVLSKVLEGLKAMGPIPPLGPPPGTQKPTTPPPVTQTP